MYSNQLLIYTVNVNKFFFSLLSFAVYPNFLFQIGFFGVHNCFTQTVSHYYYWSGSCFHSLSCKIIIQTEYNPSGGHYLWNYSRVQHVL